MPSKRPTGWLGRYYDADGKERTKMHRTRTAAVRWEREQKVATERGGAVDHRNKETVTQACRRYAATRPHKPRTARRVAGMIDNHIAPTPLGDRRLTTVRPSEVQAWATGRAQVLAPTTLRNLVSFLRSVYASAVLDRLVASSPVVKLALPSPSRERIVPLTVAEVRRLADAIPPRNRAMVITQAGLGLRIGELLALRLEDVDFLRRTARVEWQLDSTTRKRVDPKTPRSRRTIPLPAPVSDALAEHIKVFPPGADGSLFTTRYGQPYRHDYYGARIFVEAVARAGLPAGITTHDLRHHYASVLLAASESVVAVAERLGHENATLVLKVYGHLMPDSEARTRRAIEDAWSADSLRTEEAM